MKIKPSYEAAMLVATCGMILVGLVVIACVTSLMLSK